MEPCKAISKKHFVWEEENHCEEETDLTPQDRIGNIDWCKCGCERKQMATVAKSFCLLLRLNFRGARGACHHSAFMENYSAIIHAC